MTSASCWQGITIAKDMAHCPVVELLCKSGVAILRIQAEFYCCSISHWKLPPHGTCSDPVRPGDVCMSGTMQLALSQHVNSLLSTEIDDKALHTFASAGQHHFCIRLQFREVIHVREGMIGMQGPQGTMLQNPTLGGKMTCAIRAVAAKGF